MSFVPLQQRRQYNQDSSLQGQLSYVDVSIPQKLSWLPDGTRRTKESKKMKRKNLKIIWILILISFSIWCCFLLYYFLYNTDQIPVPNSLLQNEIWNDSTLHSIQRDAIPQAALDSLPSHRTHQLVDDYIPAPSTNLSGSRVGNNNVNVSKRHSIQGGPITIQKTINISQYSGQSFRQLHGILGYSKNGSQLWIPREKPPKGLDVIKELSIGGGFNLRLSDSLPLDRDSLDQRHSDCRKILYDVTQLAEASVIIVFHNEPFSTLMRSVHSVLNRTPQLLLKEIILVDDGSTKSHIKSESEVIPSQLETYIATLPKVKLIRNPQRTGIVGARLLGIENALAQIFVILDSHIEVQPVWLEPLISRIQSDRSVVVMPQVDGIDPKTFAYSSNGIGCTLGMIWDLMEHAFEPSHRNEKRMNKKVTDFVESPTMAGGLFAAHRDFFLDIGGYDRGMMYWGVENLELSFRLWQCGGKLECSKCSRVYHIFRQGGAGYYVPDPNSLMKNKLRTMAVWMDEFADLAWNVLGRPTIDYGDVSSRVKLRKELQCKPFSYFLNEVWPESDVKNLTTDVPYMGQLKNKATDLCVVSPSAHPESPAILENCSSHSPGVMYFRCVCLLMHSQMMSHLSDYRVTFNGVHNLIWTQPGAVLSACCQSIVNRWRVNKFNQIVLELNEEAFLRYIEAGNLSTTSQNHFCLSVNSKTKTLEVVPCAGSERMQGGLRGRLDMELDHQVWEWERYHPPPRWTLSAPVSYNTVF